MTAVAFHPDGALLGTATYDPLVRIWEVATGQQIGHVLHRGGVTALTFSPDGNLLATTGWDNTARIWQRASGREIAQLPHEGGVIAVSP